MVDEKPVTPLAKLTTVITTGITSKFIFMFSVHTHVHPI